MEQREEGHGGGDKTVCIGRDRQKELKETMC